MKTLLAAINNEEVHDPFILKNVLKWLNASIAQKSLIEIGFYSDTNEKYTNGSHSSSVRNVKKNLKENPSLIIMNKFAVVAGVVTHNLIRS